MYRVSESQGLSLRVQGTLAVLLATREKKSFTLTINPKVALQSHHGLVVVVVIATNIK